MAATESSQGGGGQSEVAEARCDCCGLTEECTRAYAELVRERHGGRWICGLCAEAVKDEECRSKRDNIGTEEALKRHMRVCQQFKSDRSSSPANSSEDKLISAVKNLFRRSMESPRRKKGLVFPSCTERASS